MRKLVGTGALVAAALVLGAAGDPDKDALARAESAAGELGRTLKARVVERLDSAGALAAMSVCAGEAPQLTGDVAKRTGAKVGRSSLRLRNPANAGPEWVTAWLKEQGEREAQGVKGFSRVEDTADGRVARVVKPIPVDAKCVACHGPRESLAPEVRAFLGERYPGDAAVGYRVGELRGALWSEVRVR